MATLDLESSGDSGGYSDSFELEESISLDPVESSTESETKNAVISQLKKTLNNHTSVGTRKTTQVPEPINRKQAGTKSASTSTSRNGICNKINVDGGSNIDLGMTIRSPMKLDCSDEAKELPQPNNSKFKKVAQNVTTMQSVVNTAKNFNDSLEVRDSVYSEWLARKKTQVSREASSKITAKKVEEEAKRKKEVGYFIPPPKHAHMHTHTHSNIHVASYRCCQIAVIMYTTSAGFCRYDMASVASRV